MVLDHSYPFIIVIAVNFLEAFRPLVMMPCYATALYIRTRIVSSRGRTGSSLGFPLIFAVPDADTKISVQLNVNAKE